MRTVTDPNGLPVTADDPTHAADLANLTSAYLGSCRDTGDKLKQLLSDAPEMPMALCAAGYFAKLIGSANHSARARSISAQLDERLESTRVTRREQLHAQALSAWTRGYIDTATDRWETILLEFPRDSLAVRLAHFTHFYSGDARKVRDSIARVWSHWTPEHPDFGFVQGMYAFGLQESGDYQQAEPMGRRAVERNPKDAWSVHAIAHVLEMTGRHADGIAWVEGLESQWNTVNNFRFHLYWHQALYHLERGEFARVLSIYDEQVVSDIDSDFYLDICNASSLLWRLEMYGVDVGNRWVDLVDPSTPHIDDNELIFVSLHYLMALVAAGRTQEANKMIVSIEQWATGDTTQSAVCRQVGVALANCLQLARNGEHAQTIATFEPIRYAIDCIGGSKAQRDVFHMIFLDAVSALTDAGKARALYAERVRQKETSSWSWQRYGDALAACGDCEAGARAAAQANRHLTR